jgi:hypothetical protein
MIRISTPCEGEGCGVDVRSVGLVVLIPLGRTVIVDADTRLVIDRQPQPHVVVGEAVLVKRV